MDNFMRDIRPVYQGAYLIGLLYHEARNIQNGYSSTRLMSIASKLDRNRYEAWRQIDVFVRDLDQMIPFSLILEKFKAEFGCSLIELTEAFRNPYFPWLRRCGGERWARICESVLALITDMDHLNPTEYKKAVEHILQMPHNNGCVRDKLYELIRANNCLHYKWS